MSTILPPRAAIVTEKPVREIHTGGALAPIVGGVMHVQWKSTDIVRETEPDSAINADRYTSDTHILFYALDPDASEKHHTAQKLIASADPERAVVLLQGLGELSSSVRKKRPRLAEDALRWVQRSMVSLDVKSVTPADLADAIQSVPAFPVRTDELLV